VTVKNIQIIDGAQNCVYDIFSATDEEFALVFPEGAILPSLTRFMQQETANCSMQHLRISGSVELRNPKYKASTE